MKSEISLSAGVQINLYGRRYDRDLLKRVAAQRGTSASALVMHWVRSLESSIEPNAEPQPLGEPSLALLNDNDNNQEEMTPGAARSRTGRTCAKASNEFGSNCLESHVTCLPVQQSPLGTQANGEWLNHPGRDLP